MPISVGTAISLGSSLIGGLGSSSAQSGAASEANAANQAAIKDAKARAEVGYGINQGTITRTGQQSQGRLDDAYGDTKELFQPLVDDGDKARGYYNRAAGIDGEAARNGYVNDLMARPEYAAARDLATRQTQQQYGGKLGSGAFGRALQRRDMEYANQNIDRDMQRVKPIMDTGNQARFQQANAATNYGNNSATNDWRTGNAFVSNENQLSDHLMNAALSSGASNARNARDQGAASANAYSGIANAFGSAFGGGNTGGGGGGGALSRPLSSFFS